MNPIPKPKTLRDKKYLAWIRKKPCEIPYKHTCKGKVEAAHVRKQYWGAGTSQKPTDYVAISLCQCHHKLLDKHSMEVLEETFNIDIKRIIIRNLIEYFGKD